MIFLRNKNYQPKLELENCGKKSSTHKIFPKKVKKTVIFKNTQFFQLPEKDFKAKENR